MTVGELIEKLNDLPRGLNVIFSTDFADDLRTFFEIKGIKFDTEVSPESPLNVDIMLKEVDRQLLYTFNSGINTINGGSTEMLEVINWYEEQIGRKLSEAEKVK